MAVGGESTKATDTAGGMALGLLIGLLIGLSVTPVVAIVVTALVGLLAALFGLGDKSALGISAAGARRLAAFGFAAVIATPGAIWLRTHDVLAPSLASHRAVLRDIGYPDNSPEQKAILLSLRYGTDAQLRPQASDTARRASAGVLYADRPAGFCARLQMSGVTADLLTLLDSAGDATLSAQAARIRALPAEWQAAALDYARIFLCDGG